MRDIHILLTNDDGYQAQGIKELCHIMKNYGEVTVVAPKIHQSGMSMAVDLGLKSLAYKSLGVIDGASWSYLDGTPASCVKFGLNFQFKDRKPDVVVCGINHGSNATMGSVYSGTLGAAQEAALNGILAIGVSLNNFTPDADFSIVRKYLPVILDKLLENIEHQDGIYYNINFPDIKENEVKGVRIATQGRGHWEKEFTEWDPTKWESKGITPELLGQKSSPKAEEGEQLYMMIGEFVDDDTSPLADHHLMDEGYITIVPHNIFNTDAKESKRLETLGMNIDF